MIPKEPFRRKNIRLKAENYLGRRWYFVTLCCDRRRDVFREETQADWLVRLLRAVSATYGFHVHAYSVMPDDVHLLVEGTHDASNLLLFVAELKRRTALDWGRTNLARLWQHKYYDHILRSKDSPDSVAWYIWMNPVRKQLWDKPEHYPFSGSFTME